MNESEPKDTYRWRHLKAEPTTDNDATGITSYVLGVDVDEQFKVQEALKASEQEAREILDRVPAMISIRTEEGIAYTNRRLSDYVGAVITDLRDGSYLDYIHPDDRKAVVEDHIRASDSRTDYFFSATRMHIPDQRSCPNPGGGVALRGITPTFFAVNGYRASR